MDGVGPRQVYSGVRIQIEHVAQSHCGLISQRHEVGVWVGTCLLQNAMLSQLKCPALVLRDCTVRCPRKVCCGYWRKFRDMFTLKTSPKYSRRIFIGARTMCPISRMSVSSRATTTWKPSMVVHTLTQTVHVPFYSRNFRYRRPLLHFLLVFTAVNADGCFRSGGGCV